MGFMRLEQVPAAHRGAITMDQTNHRIGYDYDIYIARALAADGGHLGIGRGGVMLFFGRGASLSSCEIEIIKDACIAAGLPVIDTRMMDFGIAARLAINGPMVAVGEPASQPPYHAFSHAPLVMVAESYRAAGAMVWNLTRVRRAAGAGEKEA
jgi:hypothetical protein